MTFNQFKESLLYTQLTVIQKLNLEQYYNGVADYSGSQYKEQTYQMAKRDNSDYGKAIVLMTTFLERSKWDFYDFLGFGSNDLLEYDTTITKTVNKVTQPLKYGSFIIIGTIIYIILKKALKWI